MTTKSEFVIPSHWEARPSPNFSKRTKAVTCIILHADAASKIESSLDWIRRAESKVSYHIMVGRTGKVYNVVHPDNKAWHAGISSYEGIKNVNDFSVGVCLSNRNDGVEVHPAAQIEEAVNVCVALCKHYKIDPNDITTHAVIAPGRKTDPVSLDLRAFQLKVIDKLLPPVR